MHKALFKPLPEQVDNPENPITQEKVELGKRLYFDTSLSQSNTISCNTCHLLDKFGVDGLPVSEGHNGQKGTRNAPSVYNAALHIAQFWDGRAKDVEEQALGPITNPIEMAMPSDQAAIERIQAKLKEDEEYKKQFALAFPGEANPVTFNNVGKAIGAFERTLMTPSRFDDYLKGDQKALSETELAGLNTFITTGCTTCHIGAGVGGSMFHKLGLVKPYPTKDLGRYEVTKQEADKYFFKVPSLRNVAETGPYFHDGSIKTLKEAIVIMGRHQLGQELTEKQLSDISAFLNALTGEIPEEFRSKN
jgi:cytochrome c peroxidase